MKRDIRVSPNYPFADAILEETVLEIDRFVADPPLTSVERGEVLEFVRLTRQYAFLETLIQGEVRCKLPMHFEFLMKEYRSTEEQAEAIAENERSLLVLRVGPSEGLEEILDERGIKVFRRSRGPESPENLTGGFHYLGDQGPALLCGVAEGCPEGSFVLAHEYGHLVMDVNPYHSRFCRWARDDLRNVSETVEERRADRFARAFLLPADQVHALGGVLGLEESEEGLVRAAETLDVAPVVLWHRLADLGMSRPATPPDPVCISGPREVDNRRPTDLPERFVNLALAAYGQRLFGKNELARFLRIPSKRMSQFLSWCPIPRTPISMTDVDEPEGSEGEEFDA